MDRKGWIMLLLCGIGMMLTYKYLIVESEEALQKQQEQEEKAGYAFMPYDYNKTDILLQAVA